MIAVAACSTGDDDPTLAGEVPTTDVRSATSTTADSTTTTTEPACPAVEPAVEGKGGLVEQTADVDFDHEPDVVQSFPEDEHVTLLVDLAAGGGATTQIEANDTATVALIGAAVLDPRFDGRDVLWVRVGAGASTTVLGLYHLDGCALEAATFENGERVELPIGGTVGTASGARCGSLLDPQAVLMVREATHIAGREYEIVTTEYRWEEGQLVLSPERAPTVARSDDLSEVIGFRCGDVAL